MAKYQKGTFITVPNKHVLSGMKSEYQSVFMWLNHFADDKGICFPSRATLANYAGCSIRMVDYALKEFEDRGIISKRVRKNGKENLTSLYQIMIVEEGDAQDAPPYVENDTTPSVENATVTQSNINSINLTHSEKEFSQKETFDEYMESLGMEPYEVITEDGVYDSYKTSTGSILSIGKLKTYEGQYEKKYGKKEGLDEIAKIIKPLSLTEQVINIFSFNKASVMWYKNKTQLEAIKCLLEICSVQDMTHLVFGAKELRKTDNFAPEIDTPYELLTKMIKLKNRSERGNQGMGIV